jgi:hypothetical protein
MTALRKPVMDDEAVAKFLLARKDFFADHPDLLAELNVHHPAGGAVSLMERQVDMLRERNADLRTQLNELLDHAAANDGIFARTRALTLGLMDAESATDVDAALGKHLIAEFHADYAICFVRGWQPRRDFAHLKGVAEDEAPPFTRLFDQEDPTCATYRPEEFRLLFPEARLFGPGSIAMVPMRGGALHAEANLAIGAQDPKRFSPQMGKVFLFYIGDVLSRTLARLRIG